MYIHTIFIDICFNCEWLGNSLPSAAIFISPLFPAPFVCSDSIGLHRVENVSHTEPAVSLHLYSPPFDSCHAFDQRTGHKNKVTMTFHSKFGIRTPFVSCFLGSNDLGGTTERAQNLRAHVAPAEDPDSVLRTPQILGPTWISRGSDASVLLGSLWAAMHIEHTHS